MAESAVLSAADVAEWPTHCTGDGIGTLLALHLQSRLSKLVLLCETQMRPKVGRACLSEETRNLDSVWRRHWREENKLDDIHLLYRKYIFLSFTGECCSLPGLRQVACFFSQHIRLQNSRNWVHARVCKPVRQLAELVYKLPGRYKLLRGG